MLPRAAVPVGATLRDRRLHAGPHHDIAGSAFFGGSRRGCGTRIAASNAKPSAAGPPQRRTGGGGAGEAGGGGGVPAATKGINPRDFFRRIFEGVQLTAAGCKVLVQKTQTLLAPTGQ